MPRNREMVATKLQRIAEKARREPNCRFTSLFHLMNECGDHVGIRKGQIKGQAFLIVVMKGESSKVKGERIELKGEGSKVKG